MSNDDTIDTLNDLIETSKDGEYGFRASAEHIENPETKQLLLARSEECRRAVTELQECVRQAGGKAEDSGSATGAMHRGWVAVKDKLTGSSDLAILEETERGEDSAMEKYRDALQEDLPPQIRSIVERQYEGVKRNHAQVRSLRDSARAAKA